MKSPILSVFTVCVLLVESPAHAQAGKPADFKLKATVIDTVPKGRLLALSVDSNDRLFVGNRQSLYVYDPKKAGGYEPRKLLYSFPPSVWISDIEVRGDHVYVLTPGALYVFIDGTRKRADLLPRKLAWGPPDLYQKGTGHRTGFRAMAWGPEGDLYLTVGGLGFEDRCGYWTFFDVEGGKLPYRGISGVFRCKSDGTGLRVVADGLLHPGGLVFDRHWNLFTSDSIGEKVSRSQYWHVTPYARLGTGIGKMDRLPALLDEDGGMIQAGPFYFDEPALPPQLRHRLRWERGGSSVDFAIKPHGATFKLEDPLRTYHPPRAFRTAGGGRVFALHDEYQVVVLTNADKEHPRYEPYESSEATPERLWQELASPSWSQRVRAHHEILRRGGDMLKDANKKLLTTKADAPAMHHLIWLAAHSGQGSVHLLGLVDHADPLVRVQTIRALTEFPDQLREEPIFTKRLLDDDPQVRLAAVSAYFDPKIPWSAAIQKEIERSPACSEDPYLRQAATLLLAQKLTRKEIESLCQRASASRRLAGVLAAGFRLMLPPSGLPLPPHLPLSHADSGYVTQYAEEKVDLRERGRIGSFTIAEHWKADKHTQEQELLFKLLRRMLKDEEQPVRQQAAAFLAVLADERARDEVDGGLNK